MMTTDLTVTAQFTSVAVVYPAPVLATGQTTCWTGDFAAGTGTEVDCSGTGQDGDIQAGVPFPDPRFIDNGDGTITDRASGLMWVQDLNCIGNRYPELTSETPPNGFKGRVYWQVGLDFVEGLNTGTYDCGTPSHNDWRMPNIRELFSVLDFSLADAQPAEPFIKGDSNTAMSSTTDIREPGNVWAIGNGGRGADLYVIIKNPDPVGQPGNNAIFLWIVRGP